MPTPDEIREQLGELLTRIAETPREDIRDTAVLKELGIDSVAIVELAEGVGTTFGTYLPDEIVNEWRTVGDVVRTVQRNDSFLASLPPPQLHDDPERIGAFKQLAVIFALIGAGLGVFIGMAAAALLASGLDRGTLPPINVPRGPDPGASSTVDPSEDSDGFAPPASRGDSDGSPTPSPSPSASSAATGPAALTATPGLVATGERFRLSGRLPGAREGEQLIIEWREDGGVWAAFPVTATARPDGTFETQVYIASPGERQFRVRSSGSSNATPQAVVRIR